MPGSSEGSLARPRSGRRKGSGPLTAVAMAALAFLALAFSACQTETPDAETVLWLELNDSLSRYDYVLVQILDRNDTDDVLATLWNKPLPKPASDIQPFRLKTLSQEDFIVRILGYLDEGRHLALHTRIDYSDGKQSVAHMEVPPMPGKDRLIKLTPSAGALSPGFHKDTAAYILSIEEGEVVNFSMTAEIPSAAMTFEGQTVAAGSPTKAVSITANPDTLTITVSDPASTPPSLRTYTIYVVPKPPPGLFLASLVPSAGELSPGFTPANFTYDLMLPNGVDTVSFGASPADPQSMLMTIGGKIVQRGQRSEIFKIEESNRRRIIIQLTRNSESNTYYVFVSLFTPPPPQ
jgi:hypothetical protein